MGLSLLELASRLYSGRVRSIIGLAAVNRTPLTFHLVGLYSISFARLKGCRHDALRQPSGTGAPTMRIAIKPARMRKLEDGAPGRRRALSPEGSRVAPDARRVSPNPPKGASPAPWRRPGAPFPVWGSGKGKQAPPRLQRTGAMTLA